MPIYEYKCELCKAVLPIIAKISDMNEEHKCPTCDLTMKRLISTPSGFSFKESGGVTGSNVCYIRGK